MPGEVLRCTAISASELLTLTSSYGLDLAKVAADESIPGSFWGDSEAGLIATKIYLRDDTPVHSFLHELCHYICMTGERRSCLHTNAGGDYAEEDAVCYLQILLSDAISGFGQDRCLLDMDAWGYSFRLGSARRWFERDAEDALASLERWGLLGKNQRANGHLRQ